MSGTSSLMESVLRAHPDVRRLAAGWLLLALTALALSTLCAVLLIAARTPLLGTLAASGALFGRALVLHVTLAVVAWFLCCAAGLWTLAAGAAAGRWHWMALALAAVGMAAMVAALFFGASTPVLANYIPVLDSPLFLAGMALFLCGVGMCCIMSGTALLRLLRAGQAALWRIGAAASMAAAAFAAAALIMSLWMTGLPTSAAGFELLAWGPGHLLQFVHVILLMSVWTVLGEHVLGHAVAPRRQLAGLLLLAAAPVLAAPLIYLNYPIDSLGFRRAFTLLMAVGCWPAPVILALRLLLQLKRAGRAACSGPLAPVLLLSILLFLLGCVLGAMIRVDSTMVPAHYHGTVGAVTLAYMGLGYCLLQAFGARVSSAALLRWQPLLYGSGLMILALALAWSGLLGVPRKTLHVDVIVQYPAYFVAMGLAGLGGLLAISGAGLFVMNVLRSLCGGLRQRAPQPARRDVRWPAFALVLSLIVTIGMLLAYWPPGIGGAVTAEQAADPREDARGHAAQKRKEEIDRRFSQGTALLNARQYEEAASQWHRVLELAPQMPEAHVNMGFAMIGLQRYRVAKSFFEVAIKLRANQANAYYGLALALQDAQDLPAALGAMRSYVHLSKSDDPYLPKANAMISEWQKQ